ILKEPVHGV
nr:Chain C, HIV REVERSE TRANSCRIPTASE EPITOPE [Human immunodeficiency virus]1HHJ_C Chain C, HIV-1 REVERSE TRANSCRIPTASE (RESIDUES 309-317) [Human immunodeficiency virus 1]1HHJ_F Chain F, HIV-1 REVERSE TRANSCRIPTASE (RESIDUES 309-317) [Human immunodeficiency virus 1]1P7Q_C Chain C, POL polyprotein [synthetic construct]2X4U_C Chain C, REVERSE TRANSCRIPTASE/RIBONUCLEASE H [Human immunodeficiency virus 1]2X4U_F Chain F, REVERSE TRANSCRIPTASE/RIBONUCLEASE H [Human immunodeficiency virus 1]6EWA_C C